MTPNPDNYVPLESARIQLCRVWFIGTGIVFVLLVFQTLIGQKYKIDEVHKVWSWFVPTTFPTLSLMVGVLGGTSSGFTGGRVVRKSFKTLTFWLSMLYLISVSATILMEPISRFESTKLFEISNYYLTPVQGLVVIAIGFMFTSDVEIRSNTIPSQNQDDQLEKAPEDLAKV